MKHLVIAALTATTLAACASGKNDQITPLRWCADWNYETEMWDEIDCEDIKARHKKKAIQ